MNKVLLRASVLTSAALLLGTALVVGATTTPAPRTVNGACMASAVDKRDTAIAGAATTYGNSVSTALTTRRDALKAAWNLPVTDKTSRDARSTAIKAAWKAFQGTWKTAHKALNTARTNAWNQFRTDAKVCHPSKADAADVNAGAGVDNSI